MIITTPSLKMSYSTTKMEEKKFVTISLTIEGKTEEKTRPKLVLLGDSVLDSSYWLSDPTDNLTTQLRKLMPEYEVVNLAVDQMTTYDLEKRTPRENPWMRYQIARNKAFTTPETKGDVKYPVHEDGNIYSFRNLASLAKSSDVQVVVLSIGGNDLYLRPDMQIKLAKSLVSGKGHLRDTEAKSFGLRYQQILEKISAAAPGATIIPVVPYHPHFSFSLLYGAQTGSGVGTILPWLTKQMQWLFLSKLVSPLVKEILLASLNFKGANSVHVIDLSKTFDPKDETDYGTGAIGKSTSFAPWSGAEPSCKSSLYIAHLIRETTRVVKILKTPNLIWRDKTLNEILGVDISPEFIEAYKFGP